MDPDKHDITEIRRRTDGVPWREIHTGDPAHRPHRDGGRRMPGPPWGPVVALIVVLLIAAVVLVTSALVIGTLSQTLKQALGDEGIAIVFYGFTLITLLGAIQLLKQRGG